jgi:hypothetical protein
MYSNVVYPLHDLAQDNIQFLRSYPRINLMVVASSLVILREPSIFEGGSLCTPVDTSSYVSFLDVHNINRVIKFFFECIEHS